MKLEIKNKNAKFYNEFHTTHYTVGQIQISFHQKWLKSLNKHDDISGLFDRVLGHFHIGCAHPENYPFFVRVLNTFYRCFDRPFVSLIQLDYSKQNCYQIEE